MHAYPVVSDEESSTKFLPLMSYRLPLNRVEINTVEQVKYAEFNCGYIT